MIHFSEKLILIGKYSSTKIKEQLANIAFIIGYLVLFQTFILGIQIAQALTIATGMLFVLLGLALFMEGLVLGLMPLGEVIGLKLPQKAGTLTILLFAFGLGFGATFAEPAIGVLKAAGANVKAWEAPLLFLLLTKYSSLLVYFVGMGVGIAVVFGMMRFMYNWSLKPFLYLLVGSVCTITLWSGFDPNMAHITGLAWDCGAVTTGPVTVPLVLALGIGISRVVSKGDHPHLGFGVVTLASLFPILAVMTLGLINQSKVPQPMPQKQFFQSHPNDKVLYLFSSRDAFLGYALHHADYETWLDLYGSKQQLFSALTQYQKDPKLRTHVFGNHPDALENWAHGKGNQPILQLLGIDPTAHRPQPANTQVSLPGFLHGIKAAFQAIFPLSFGMLLVLFFIIKSKPIRLDETLLGIVFCFVGMTFFNGGIEFGLAKLGNQLGSILPASFKSIDLVAETQEIKPFALDVVQTSIDSNGDRKQFFFYETKGEMQSVPFHPQHYHEQKQSYRLTPTIGPLFGQGFLGILIVLVFAFFMGYGATLAEPALNALGATVETITVGNFKKTLLMQAVAIGVGIGITLGVAKIIWNIPLVYLLLPPYLVLLPMTYYSLEDYVNIGWDSAGVTTGPITVPLVLAMGLGIGSQTAVIEGFGILAMASVCPVLCVLAIGLHLKSKRNASIHRDKTR